jgi:hypothetical protein
MKMERVKVVFYLEVSDPNDNTGLSSAQFDSLHDIIMSLGGDDVDIRKVEDSE